MGLFNHKQQPKGDSLAAEDDASQEPFFDEYYREELRNHGRWYFEKLITENGGLFKQDLETTISQVKSELDEHVTTRVDETVGEIDQYLKAHVTRKLDEQFARYSDAVRVAQATALADVTESTRKLQEQHQQMTEALRKSVEEQTSILHGAFDENKADIIAMKDAQTTALHALQQSAAEVETQYKTLSTTLQETVASQKEMLINAFTEHMSEVVEHYVLESLGEQFDLKSQLPSIMKQMEANKQAMVDDLAL